MSALTQLLANAMIKLVPITHQMSVFWLTLIVKHGSTNAHTSLVHIAKIRLVTIIMILYKQSISLNVRYGSNHAQPMLQALIVNQKLATTPILSHSIQAIVQLGSATAK